MVRQNVTLTSFNGGEVSPLLDARTDLDFYPNTCKKLLNFIPRAQGPIERRKGFEFVALANPAGGVSVPTRLYPFIFSTGQAYMLEFSVQRIRVFTSAGEVTLSTPITTPYAASELFDLQFAQTADLLYVVHPNHQPHRLARTTLAPDFTFLPIPLRNGPVLDENTTNVTLRPSGETGVVTVTASAAIFNNNMVGGIWAISEPSGSLGWADEWQPFTSFAASQFVRSNNSIYQNVSGTGLSSNIPPSHKRGDVSDGSIIWRYINDGTGFIRFDSIVGPEPSNTFSGTVQVRLPSQSTLPAGTLFWNEGAWSNDQGWPRAIAVYEQRAFYAGTRKKPQTIWASKTNNRFEDFDTGAGNDDDAIVFDVDANQVDVIQWLTGKTVLLAGTSGGIFVAKPSALDQIITPSNVQIKRNTNTSCSKIAPELVNNLTMFVHRAGRKIYSSSYNFDSDSFISDDITIRAEHITFSGVRDINYQQEPYGILWMTLNNGLLLGATVDTNQKVIAWHRHDTNRYDNDGNFIRDSFESVASIPTSDSEELWVTVKREIEGVETRFIEVMRPGDLKTYYVDSGKYYEGAAIPAGQYGGFTHLIGQEVQVLLSKSTSTTQELAVTPNQIVNSSGEITLPYPCTKIVVGLPYYSDIQTNKLNMQTQEGFSMGRPARVNRVAARIYNTLGLQIGYNANNLTTLPFRNTFNLMDNPPPELGTIDPKDYEVDFGGTWDINSPTIYIRQAQPLPTTIISLSIQGVANAK